MKYSKFFPWNNKIWDKNLSMISWAYLMVNGEHIKDAKDSSNFYLNCKMMQHVEQSIPRLDLTFLTSSRIYCLLSPIVCAELAIFFSLLTCNQEQSCQSIILEHFLIGRLKVDHEPYSSHKNFNKILRRGQPCLGLTDFYFSKLRANFVLWFFFCSKIQKFF